MVPATVQVSVADRATTDAAGVRGVLFTLLRADGLTGPSGVALDVDYSGFANAYGGGYGGRLRLVRMPACVLSTPEVPQCQWQTPVDTGINTPDTHVVSDDALDVADPAGAGGAGTFPLPPPGTGETVPVRTDGQPPNPTAPSAKTAGAAGPGTADLSGQPVYALTASAASDNGDYSQTSLSPTYSWTAGTPGGGFDYDVPITLPPAPAGGPSPDLKLSYSSSLVDGRSNATNNQASVLGEGWDLQTGYIERSFRTCGDDGSTDHPNDLCYFSDANAMMVFNGRSTPLVKDDTTRLWHGQADDGSRIESVLDLSDGNQDVQGMYWKVTTLGGTQYFFGRNRIPGKTETTNSTQTALVYSNFGSADGNPNNDEPCWNANQHNAGCYMAYRWNLDYVVDPRGNTTSYFYSRWQASYGAWNGTDAHDYDLSSTLTRIDYGTRAESENATPPVRVNLGYADRCSNPTSGCNTWPDVPWDQLCNLHATSCPSVTQQSFFTRFRLAMITTTVLDESTGSYRNVDQYTTNQFFPDPGDGSPPSLDLLELAHVGKVGGADLAAPNLHFASAAMANHVPGSSGNSSGMNHFRITAIGNGSGGTIQVDYSPTECTATTVAGITPSNNPYRCYPTGDGHGMWFHNYRVTKVSLRDDMASPTEEFNYSYSTAGSNTTALWTFDLTEQVPRSRRTWSTFAGYSTVTVLHGAATATQSTSTDLYYRGMDGDFQGTGAGLRSGTLTDSNGNVWLDSLALRGYQREARTQDGATVVAKTFHHPSYLGGAPTATRTASWDDGTIRAYHLVEADQESQTQIAGGAWRYTQTNTSYNSYGLPTSVSDLGDTGPAGDNSGTATGDDTCTTNTYATPDTTKYLIDYPSQIVTTDCTPSPTGNHYLSGSQTAYDGGAVGATPTAGLATANYALDTVAGSTLSWVQTAHGDYDTYGRIRHSYDALNRMSQTVYTPATNGPTTQVTVTNPLSHATTTALDPARGQATTVVDPNGKTTTLQYDSLGRLIKVFKPHPTTMTGYTAATATQTFTDIAATGTPVALTGDDNHADIDLPFPFSFYGTTYNDATLSSNGLLSFTDTVDDSAPTGLPNSAPPNAVIAPFWADLVLDSSSSVVTATTGTAPNRQFTIEWVNATFYAEPTIDTSKRVTFTATLSENGTIAFNYTGISSTDTTERGATATVGVENSTGTTGTQSSHNQAVLATNRAVTLTPNTTPTTTLPDIEYTYTLTGSTTTANSVTTKTLTPAGTQQASYQLYDGHFRLRQTQTAADQAHGGRIVIDTAYDTRGQPVKTSTFWNSGAPSGTTLLSFADTAVQNQHRYTYDTVQRKTSDGLYAAAALKWQTSYGYTGDRTWTIPPAGGTPTMTITDAHNRTVGLRQYTAGTPTGAFSPPPGTAFQTTSYSYDRLGHLTTVTDPDTNLWTNTYDLRGRITGKTDPDTGNTTLSYDDAGQLTTTTDARNISLSYSYDNLGRKTGLYDGAGTGGFQRAKWVYDTIAKGHLTSATRYVNSTDAYTVAVTGYNNAYQPLGTKVTIPVVAGQPAGDWEVDTSYNVDGSIATISYPGGGGLPAETVTDGYDTTGRPLSLTGAATYVSATTYQAFGPTYQQLLGGGNSRIRQTTSVDEASGRLTANSTETETSPNAFIQQLRELYGYDDAGNVTTINEVNASGATLSQQCFTYDPLQQLKEAWSTTAVNCQATPSQAVVGGPDPYWSSYTYTATGSRATENRHASTGDTLRTYLYPASGPRHTLTSVAITGAATGTDSYTYDAIGNTKTRNLAGKPGQTLTWDNEGHLGSVADTSGTSSYIYDADGNRLVAKDSGAVTVYLPGFELRQVGSTVTATRYYGTMAARTPTGLTWLASDPHGSNQLAINATSLAVTRRKVDPFGNPRDADPTWPTTKGFVGGTRDYTGLTHLGAREYEPTAGRFISADPVFDATNPQTTGGYSYAGNNPVTKSDPTGLRLPDCEGNFQQCGPGGTGDDGKPHPTDGDADAPGWDGKPNPVKHVPGKLPTDLMPERCRTGSDSATGCMGPAQWSWAVVDYANEAGIDPRLLMAILMIEVANSEGWAPVDEAVQEGQLAADRLGIYGPLKKLSGRPASPPSLGWGNLQEGVFNDAKKNHPEAFEGKSWSDMIGDHDFAIKATAYVLRDLVDFVKQKTPASMRKSYTPESLAAATYQVGQAKMQEAFARGSLGPQAAKYSGAAMSHYYGSADKLICHSGVYTC